MGAWENWFFWPFAILIFVSSLLFLIREMILPPKQDKPHRLPDGSLAATLTRLTCLAFVLFLIYAFVRCALSPVRLDAERSFLLFLLPFLIALPIVFSFKQKNLEQLYAAIFINLLLLGSYGILNHFFFQNKYVMWLPGEPQYQFGGIFRATGSFVCPDHFSGAMEFLLCISAGLILERSEKRWMRQAGILGAIMALSGIYLSKSRGGGLTAIIIIISSLAFCLPHQQRKQRWAVRLFAGLALMGILLLTLFTPNLYAKRFKSYFIPASNAQQEHVPLAERIHTHLSYTARYVMFSAAFEAWQTSPIWGIGPGMHQNLWPHFAPSNDGNRDLGIYPSRLNNTFHSYEVHNDWLQLLEEHGVVGFVFFLVPYSLILLALVEAKRIGHSTRHKSAYPIMPYRFSVSALLVFIGMSFHSLGDFNLQIPALGWILGALLVMPFAFMRRRVSLDISELPERDSS